MTRLEELALRLADGELSAPEAAELVRLARRDEEESARLIGQLLDLEALLRRPAAATTGSVGTTGSIGSMEDRVLNAIEGDRRRRTEENVLRAIESRRAAKRSAKRSATRGVRGISGRLGSRPFGAAISLAAIVAIVALAVCIAFWSLGRERGTRRETLLVRSPAALLHWRNQESGEMETIELGEGAEVVAPGQMIEVRDPAGSAVLSYADRTEVELLGRTTMTVGADDLGGKHLLVHSGVVQADVVPQPTGRPLRVSTPTAELEVVGTSLGVEVAPAMTRLMVSTGVVSMTRSSDGTRIDVPAGRVAHATRRSGEPLRAAPVPSLAENWSEDFDRGLPPGWISGEAVAIETEPGTVFAARAIRRRREGLQHTLTSQNAWSRGENALCQLRDDSTLSFRFRQERVGRITVMVAARAFPPQRGRKGANLFYTRKSWSEDLAPGEWRTARVPLRLSDWHIRGGVRRNGSAPLDGLAAYMIQITTMERDLGLTIDWVALEREGEGEREQ